LNGWKQIICRHDMFYLHNLKFKCIAFRGCPLYPSWLKTFGQNFIHCLDFIFQKTSLRQYKPNKTILFNFIRYGCFVLFNTMIAIALKCNHIYFWFFILWFCSFIIIIVKMFNNFQLVAILAKHLVKSIFCFLFNEVFLFVFYMCPKVSWPIKDLHMTFKNVSCRF